MNLIGDEMVSTIKLNIAGIYHGETLQIYILRGFYHSETLKIYILLEFTMVKRWRFIYYGDFTLLEEILAGRKFGFSIKIGQIKFLPNLIFFVLSAKI